MPKRPRGPKVDRDVERIIGQRVRQLRVQLGKSQQTLAEECGLSFQQIQKYEKGSNRVSVSRMLEFCEHLQTTPNDITGWKASTPALNSFDSKVFAAAREFSAMPEDVQMAVRRICNALMTAMGSKKSRAR
jgi:transcriptional regulator with XRE-family HTH domain